jgi:HEPN domain-containing protein
MDLSMGLIKSDILMARQGIELYKNNEIKEVKNQAAYHLQQAAEKLIKEIVTDTRKFL